MNRVRFRKFPCEELEEETLLMLRRSVMGESYQPLSPKRTKKRQKEVVVSDHAVVRWIERTPHNIKRSLIDREANRQCGLKEIIKEQIMESSIWQQVIELGGNGVFPISELRLRVVLKEFNVITFNPW